MRSAARSLGAGGELAVVLKELVLNRLIIFSAREFAARGRSGGDVLRSASRRRARAHPVAFSVSIADSLCVLPSRLALLQDQDDGSGVDGGEDDAQLLRERRVDLDLRLAAPLREDERRARQQRQQQQQQQP